MYIRLTLVVRQPYKTRMQLADYMAREKLRDGEFARRIGRSRVTVNRIRRGLIRPSWDTIKAIRAATRGEVTADDFEAGREPCQR
jgi:transcriptional regulator with XRE-family HTH domain